MKVILVSIFVSILGAKAYGAGFQCYTHSNEILFKAIDEVEAKANERVVNGCIEYPFTDAEECKEHVRCFPNEDELEN